MSRTEEKIFVVYSGGEPLEKEDTENCSQKGKNTRFEINGYCQIWVKTRHVMHILWHGLVLFISMKLFYFFFFLLLHILMIFRGNNLQPLTCLIMKCYLRVFCLYYLMKS